MYKIQNVCIYINIYVYDYIYCSFMPPHIRINQPLSTHQWTQTSRNAPFGTLRASWNDPYKDKPGCDHEIK